MDIHRKFVNLDILKDLSAFNTKKYDSQEYFKIFEDASLHNISITQTCDIKRLQGETCPSMEQVMKCCRQNSTPQMIEFINAALKRNFDALPSTIRQHVKKSGILFIDYHQDPYYGQEENPHVKKGKSKASTKYFHEYLTADAYSGKGSIAVGIIPRVPEEAIIEQVKRLFVHVEQVLSPKKVVFDGEFANVEVLTFFQNKDLFFLGRKSRTPRVKAHLNEYYAGDDWEETRKWRPIEFRAHRSVKETVMVDICPQNVHGEMKVMIKSPKWKITPQYAEKLLRKRFNQETGYRDKHKFQIFTNTKVLGTRLLFLLFAALLWNCWQTLLMWVRALKSYSKRVPRSFSITLTSTWIKFLLKKLVYS